MQIFTWDISGYTAMPWLRYTESREVHSFNKMHCGILFLSALSAPPKLPFYYESQAKQELNYSVVNIMV